MGWCHAGVFRVEFTWNDPQVKGKKKKVAQRNKKGGGDDEIKRARISNELPFYHYHFTTGSWPESEIGAWKFFVLEKLSHVAKTYSDDIALSVK